MKVFPFIQYFFYLGINWNWRIAFHILFHEIQGEKKYGIHTTGSDELKNTAASGVDISHATVYMPASYLLLEDVFTRLPGNVRNHFLDIGCGKGRVLCVAANYGFKKVTGIDFSTEFCNCAIGNLQLTKNRFNSLEYKIINQDAVQTEIPDDVDCIFFFNPFDLFIMKKVSGNIRNSYNRNPRNIYVIYFNPLYKKELTGIGFKEIYYTRRMKYMEAVILHVPNAPSPSR